MALTLNEIRESGLLELYVLNALSMAEKQAVEESLAQFPELKNDLVSIENAYEKYALAHRVKAPDSVLHNVKQLINNGTGSATQAIKSSGSTFGWLWGILFAALAVGAGWFLYNLSQEKDALNQELIDCEEEQEEKDILIANYESINNDNTTIVLADATEKYPDTKVYIFNNEADGKTYLKLQNMPELQPDQDYQLWSLKGQDSPIPLDVFNLSTGTFIEVQHEAGTNAYAITIEPKGGQDAPTMANLVGVFPIS